MSPKATLEAASLERYVPRIATDWDSQAGDSRTQEIDGTMCFVDISGFTNLSEKLARRGRIGAEELTGVLNLVFGKMLEVAYRQGGSLLKFGGDALLLLYTGNDHAGRASSAAVEMRSVLKQAEGNRSSAGRLRLRMSVGIHSGPIHLFRAGNLHSELVIAGSSGTTTALMEKTAEPGEIVVSPDTADRLPVDAVGARTGAGFLLRWRKPHCVAPGAVVRDSREPDVLLEWLPTALRAHLSAGSVEPEHRIASVAFIRFCGVDAAIRENGPAWVAAAIDSTISTIQHAADSEGVTFLGTDINEDGGKAILVAGAPTSVEGDAARMLRAARRIADTDLPLDVHIGINRGHVFSGEVGTAFRATYTVMGDTVNLAARLMAAAPARAVYATPTVLDHSNTLFTSAGLPPFSVKGKDEPVKAYNVFEEAGERSRNLREGLPFVGRDAEVQTLSQVMERTRVGEASVVTVTGSAGLGKSRLVARVADANADIPVLAIRSEPYGSATPYRPFRDHLRSLLQVERGTDDSMREAMLNGLERTAPELLPMATLLANVAHINMEDTPEVADIEPPFRQARLIDAVIALFEVAYADPLVLWLEDAHWMDDASTALITRLIDELEEHPWTILITRRTDAGGPDPASAVNVNLAPLRDEEARALVHRATQATPLHPDEVDAVVRRTAGNPLFIAEVLRIVSETGSMEGLPDSLDTLMGQSIDALPPLTRRILRYASVLGRSFRGSTVNAILAEDGLELDAATRESLAELLEPTGQGRFRFRTPLVRDVAYEGLSFRRREVLHRRAAAAIADTAGRSPDAAADQLAMHYHLANDHPMAWRFSLMAAERAERTFANREAEVQLQRAIAAGRKLDAVSENELSAVWMRLGDVRERGGLFDSALEAFRMAGRLTNDHRNRAEILLKRAGVRERASDYSQALRDATRAEREAEHAGPGTSLALAARARAFRATVRQKQGKVAEAERTADVAAGLARDCGDRAALALAFSVTAWVHLVTDQDDALDLCEQSLALYAEIGDLVGQGRMNNNLGVLAYFADRWDDAITFYGRSRDMARRVGNVVDAAIGMANIGEVFVNQRRFEEAKKELTEARRVFRSTGELSMAIFTDLQLGRAYLETRDFGKAHEMLTAVLIASREHGFVENAAEAGIFLAETSLRRRAVAEAAAELDAAMAEAGEQAGMFALAEDRLRGLILHRSGESDEGRERIETGLDLARDRGQRYEEAQLLKALSSVVRTSDPERAEDLNREATAIFASFGCVSALGSQ